MYLYFFPGDSTAMENDIDNFIQHDEVKNFSIEVIIRIIITITII